MVALVDRWAITQWTQLIVLVRMSHKNNGPGRNCSQEGGFGYNRSSRAVRSGMMGSNHRKIGLGDDCRETTRLNPDTEEERSPSRKTVPQRGWYFKN